MSNEVVKLNIEGNEVMVSFGNHTLNERCLDRGITHYSIAALVLSLGTELLDMSMSESKEFGIVDVGKEEAAICSMSVLSGQIWVDVITVVDTRNLYVKNGARVLKFNDVTEKGMKD